MSITIHKPQGKDRCHSCATRGHILIEAKAE